MRCTPVNDLGPLERSVLELIYGLAREGSQWPTFGRADIRMDRELHVTDTQAVLKTIPSLYLRPNAVHSELGEVDELRLTLRGVATCESGSKDLGLLLELVKWTTYRERDPGLEESQELVITSTEFADHLGLDLGDPAINEESGVSDEVSKSRTAMRDVYLLAGLLQTFYGSHGTGVSSWQWSFYINRRRQRIYRAVQSIDDLVDLIEPLPAIDDQKSSVLDVKPTTTEVDSEAPQRTYDFDVAVSFAGEDREYVLGVVEALKAAQVTVFYDEDQSTEMWGEDLVEYFDSVYQTRSRFVLMFVSRHYASKMWTRHERRSAMARALSERFAYILPVRLDEADLDGLRSTVAYLDARVVGQDRVVDAVLTKLERADHHQPIPILRTPRTELERQRLLAESPPGWEHLTFAAQLLHERGLTEPKYLDFESGYAPLSGKYLAADDVPSFGSRALDDILAVIHTLERLLSPAAQERALGAPGEMGDSARIRHLASRLNSTYEALLDWAAGIRGVSTPSEYRPALELLSRFVEDAVHAYRNFIDEFVAFTDQIPRAVAEGRVLSLEHTLTINLPEEVTAEFLTELRRVIGQAQATGE